MGVRGKGLSNLLKDGKEYGGRGRSDSLNYPDGFKQRMVSRMVGAGAISATSLARDVGIPQATLSRWLREAGSIGFMSKKKTKSDNQSPRGWSIEKKVRVVHEAMSLSDDELGEFLRREGLHEVQLQEMRQAVEEALGSGKKKAQKKARADAKKIKKLERELVRKEKALAEMAALVVLKKKLDAYFQEDGEGGTPRKNGK